MTPALLDTDILSEIVKGIDASVAARAKAYITDFGFLTFTAISVYEILSGLHRKNAARQIHQCEVVFSQHTEVSPNVDDYRLAAEIGGAMVRNGTPIGVFDPIIAACAIRRRYTLVTGNIKHFESIRAANFPVDIENWRVD